MTPSNWRPRISVQQNKDAQRLTSSASDLVSSHHPGMVSSLTHPCLGLAYWPLRAAFLSYPWAVGFFLANPETPVRD